MTLKTQLKIERHCKVCGAAYQVYQSDTKNGRGLFCSRSCWAKYRTGANSPNWKGGSIRFICPICSKEFFLSRSRAKNRDIRCCSRACANKFYRGKNSRNWNGGNYSGEDGYIRTTIGDCKKKYKLTHRLIVEKVLGRLLKREEIVHHVNGDRKDNRHSNLLVCDSKYHNSLHWKMSGLYQQEHFE